MSEHLFLFVQLEFPWELGPPDGRYLLRAHTDAEPERVVVLATQGAGLRTAWRAHRPRRAARGRAVDPEPEPALVPTSRATIIDPTPVAAERQAKAWLRELDVEHTVRVEVGVLNRVLHMHRLSSADPYVHEVAPEQALAIRAGWGEGEHVADGKWLFARELRVSDSGGATRPRRRRRAGRVAALRPQERFAELLGARSDALVCEEFALRARLDLDHGRLEHAAAEIANAYRSALEELRAERLPELAIRLAELEALAPTVGLAPSGASVGSVSNEPPRARTRARAAPQSGESDDEPRVAADSSEAATESSGASAAPATEATEVDSPPAHAAPADEETLRHALERLEAALRARAAAGGRA